MVDISNNLFSTTDASNNAASPNGYSSTTTPANVVAIEQALRGALKRLYERMGPVLSTTGSANAYVVTPSNATYPAAYVQGDIYCQLANFSNTGAATLAYNGLTATAINKNSTSGLVALTGNEIQNGTAFIVVYDGTVFELINPVIPPSGSGTVNSGTSGRLAYYASSTNAVSGNAQVTVSSSNLTLGVAGSTTGGLILSGSSSGATTLAAINSGGGTLNLPGGSDTLVARATTDTLTNKTFDTAGSGNSFKINGTAITAKTGSGSAVLATSPTITTPTINQANLVGTTTNDNAAAGSVGEYISSTVLVGSAVSLSSSATANITSISLTAGDWDVEGNIVFNPAGSTTTTLATAAINTTSATLPTAPGAGAYNFWFTSSAGTAAGFAPALPTGMTRISLASTTTVYLVAQATFGVSTETAYGFIGARRAR